jgi:PPOX class probable F420-dependent enzyme
MKGKAMTIVFPDSHRDLLTRPLHVMLVTLMPDGSPQASIVWRLWDDPFVLISAHKHSQKTRNVRRDPRITLLMVDPQNAYRYIELRGTVERIVDDSDFALIDRVAQLYLQQPYYGGAEPLENKGKVEHVYFQILPCKVNSVGYQQLV